MPYHQGAEPPWFGAAMARAQAPILASIGDLREDIGQLQEDIGHLQEDVARLSLGLGQVRRVAALVEPHIASFPWVSH